MLNCHLLIIAYFDIAKHSNIEIYLNIAINIFKCIKLSKKRNKNKEHQKKKYKTNLSNFFFLAIKLG